MRSSRVFSQVSKSRNREKTSFKARQIAIKAKKEVFSEYVGSHTSRRKGEGYDFAELREYSIGDDVRHIDWTISAKMAKPYVKLFHEEHRLFINVVSILGGSVYFGSVKLKQDLIAEIAAILFFSAVKKGDVYSSCIATDKEEYRSKISGSQGLAAEEIEQILNFDPIGKVTDLESFVKDFEKVSKRRSMIFLIGDFLAGLERGKIPNITKTARKHEAVAIVVRDRIEESLGSFENSSFVDPSTKKVFFGDITQRIKNEYREKIQSYDEQLFSYFRKNKIRYIKIYTDEDPFKKLLRFLNG